MNVLCLFEQSGTFKNAFFQKGHKCQDIDIKNDFGETDLQLDLFEYITNTKCYYFNCFDLIIAFFPCTWFSHFNTMIINRNWKNFKNWSEKDIDNYVNNRLSEREKATNVLKHLISKVKKPLIIENPRSPYIYEILGKPAYYDKNRQLHGDNYVKPTYFYCFNGVQISELDIIPNIKKCDIRFETKVNRSLITPTYASNFINHIIM